jgi:pimeloyl-ACP methyl ester carboxylesterase
MTRAVGELKQIDVGSFALRVDTTTPRRPNFLCLHGLVDTLEIWDRLAPPLAERGGVVRVDQRGHGESGAPPGPYCREDLAADAVAVLDGLGIETAVLVGHSMGGIIAMTTALTYPERVAGLVLIGTASQCSLKVAGWYARIAEAGESHGLAGLARAIYGKDSDRELQGDAAGIAAVTRTLRSLYSDPLTPKLPEIRCPVLLVVGEKDPMGPKASHIIAKQLSAATLEVVPGCGHWIHVERPDAVLSVLDPWLASHGLAGPH